MKTIPHYCQFCGANNQIGERTCHKCGTRLMLVVFPPSIRHDEGIVPSYYEDHLLERVTLLEIRLSQIAERLSTTLDLLLQQSKNSQADHLLLETLIDSLESLGTIEETKVAKKIELKAKKEKAVESEESKIVKEIFTQFDGKNKDIFEHFILSSVKYFFQGEEKQALRTLEQCLKISPQNEPLLLFTAHQYFQSDKFNRAKELLEKSLVISPNNEKAAMFLGLININNLDFINAEKCFNKLTNRLLMTFCVQYANALTAIFENDWKNALEFLKGCANAEPSPEIDYLMGCVFFQSGKPKMTLNFLHKAVESDPNFADAWFMLAQVYGKLNDEVKFNQSMDLAWTAKENGAECLKFIGKSNNLEFSTALPFLRLKDLSKNLIMGSSIRFSKLFRKQLSKILFS